jgi:hypothetical protein
MLTSDAPKMEPPMEAANPASSPQTGTAAGAGGEAIVVAQQPVSGICQACPWCGVLISSCFSSS